MDEIWETNLIVGKNPSHTAGFFNAYDSREFTPEQVLAREVGQNAIDAGRNNKGITKLEFHKLRIEGAAKKHFLDAFKFSELLAPRLDAFKANKRRDNFREGVERFLGDEPISLLLIRDFNTVGLGGRWDRYRPKIDHFARLVCATNLDDKADGDPNSGGSYGLGKTAYAKSSAIYTVLYHSVFEASLETADAHRRLMVAGVYPRHQIEANDYGGFAYFGERAYETTEEAKPFENEDAESRWGLLSQYTGQDLTRDVGDHGTDVLIIMDALELGKIRTAIEDYYFPAILDGTLSVKFVEEDGSVEFPKVKERPDLDQFIRLMEKAKAGVIEETETLQVDHFNKRSGYKLGCYAFELAEADEAQSEKNNRVAIMRGTGMVINYVKLGSEKFESAVGAFIADEEVWPFLLSSENAAHSEWNENSWRLKSDHSEVGQNIVATVNSVLNNRFQKFQRSLQPDVSKSRTESGLLAKILAKALAGNNGDNPPPPGDPNPVSINLQQKKREETLSVWRLQVHDNENTPDKPFMLRLQPSISLAGDAKMVPIRHMEFRIKDANGQVLQQGTKPELEFTFDRGSVLDLGVEFENPGRKNFIVQCKFTAEVEAQDVGND
jgi:hypothetical protein